MKADIYKVNISPQRGYFFVDGCWCFEASISAGELSKAILDISGQGRSLVDIHTEGVWIVLLFVTTEPSHKSSPGSPTSPSSATVWQMETAFFTFSLRKILTENTGTSGRYLRTGSSHPMIIFATYGPAEFEPSPIIYGLRGLGKEGREKEETVTPSTGREKSALFCCFVFRDETALMLGSLRLLSQATSCHVPSRKRTISGSEGNNRSAIKAHPNWNLNVSTDLLCHSGYTASSLPLPPSQIMGRKNDWSFIQPAWGVHVDLITVFQAFLRYEWNSTREKAADCWGRVLHWNGLPLNRISHLQIEPCQSNQHLSPARHFLS